MPRSAMVDWGTAVSTGRKMAATPPQITPSELHHHVADLRDCARAARGPVAQTTRLTTPGGLPDALIIDRPGWVEANIASFAPLLEPALSKVARAETSQRARSIGGKMAGAEAGAMLGWLSSKVLGQYDLAPQGTPRLLLVAPNILAVQRELAVDPHDFRLWVCLHEETHRVQFTAVSWLRDHMIDRSRQLVADLAPDPETAQERLKLVRERLPEIMRGEGTGLAGIFATEEQRAEMARVTAVMSLLEGHADVVMDEVGPQVVPTVAEIRAKFEERRKGKGGLDKLLRRLLGLEAKTRQYRDGAHFVRGVIDAVGWDGFNRVWTSPNTLPSPEEILQPQAWVARVHAGR